MSKAIFRYLRGELNGFYLNALHETLNTSSKDIKDFLATFERMQFNRETMDDETIYNIGRFAGVFLPRLSSAEGYGAFRMSESKVVSIQGLRTERSERGLFVREQENFKFVHLEHDFDSADDINTQSNINQKSSLVGSENVRGYISSDETDVITEEGNIDTSKVSSQIPEGKAYSEFYGNQFLFISEPFKTVTNIDVELFFPLYKVLQYIRYNGANIVSLCKIISILCPDGFVKIVSIDKASEAPYITVTYCYNDAIELSNKLQRIATLLYVVDLKFPQIVMVEGEL